MSGNGTLRRRGSGKLPSLRLIQGWEDLFFDDEDVLCVDVNLVDVLYIWD